MNPVVAWAQAHSPSGGSGTCFTRAVAVHSDGWSVVVGSMDTEIYVDTKTTLALPDGDGNYTGFVARYEADGSLKWSNSLVCDSPCTAYSVAVMTDGDVVICGYFEGALAIDQNVTIKSSAGEDGFVARFGDDGSFKWCVQVSGTGTTQALGVAPLSEGAVAVGGLFDTDAAFYDPKGTQENPTLTASTQIDGFIVKYDVNGALQWTCSTQGDDDNADGQGYSAVWSVATTANGDSVIVSGSFAGTLTFSSDASGKTSFTSTVDSSGVETSDVFVTSFKDSDGTMNWAQVAGGADYDETYNVAVDQNDASVRMTGGFRGDIIFNGTDTLYGSTEGGNAFVSMFKSDGSFAWARGTICDNTTDDAAGFSSAIDSNGGTVIIGWFFGSISFDGGSTSFQNTDARDVFMARYDIDGNFDWAKIEPSNGKSGALGCAILTSDDTIWVCGFYHDSQTLIGTDNGDGTTNDTTLSGESGVMNGFLARFDDDGSV